MIPKLLDGVTWNVPERGERKWSADGTGILVALIDRAENSGLKSGVAFFSVDSVATTLLSAGAILTPAASIHRVAGASAPVTLDTTTPIAAGLKAGQKLVLAGVHATNTVTLPSGGVLLFNGPCVLGLGDVIELWWDAVLGTWFEKGRNS